MQQVNFANMSQNLIDRKSRNKMPTNLFLKCDTYNACEHTSHEATRGKTDTSQPTGETQEAVWN